LFIVLGPAQPSYDRQRLLVFVLFDLLGLPSFLLVLGFLGLRRFLALLSFSSLPMSPLSAVDLSKGESEPRRLVMSIPPP